MYGNTKQRIPTAVRIAARACVPTSRENMIIYCGWKRETEMRIPVERIDDIAGRIDCLECGSRGIWDFGYDGSHDCVCCKGTGKQLVSI